MDEDLNMRSSRLFVATTISVIAAALLSILAGLAIGIDAAAAKDFPPFGDHGDRQTTATCPAKQFLVGARVRAGDWMDEIALICAPYTSDGVTGTRSTTAPFGGNGGAAPVDKTCAANEIIVGVGLLMTPDNRQVRMLRFNCASLKTPTTHSLDVGNTTHGAPSNIRQDCPPDEAIVGMKINYGLHVNAIGVMCSHRPQVAPQGH
jgi:hypothetical protein